MRCRLFIFGLTVMAAAVCSRADERFTDHGVPAPVARARAFYAVNAEDGHPLALIWFRDVERNSVLLVDLRDGSSVGRDLPVKAPDAPYATFLHDERILYAVTGGRFWGFDVWKREWVVNVKVGDDEAMVFTRGPDGTIYAATYPRGHLMAIDPSTREVTDFGAINKESWPQYPRALAVDREGWVYSGIGNVASQVAAYNSATGDARSLASGEERARGRGDAFLGVDGEVYGRLRPGGTWYRFLGGEAVAVKRPGADPVRFRSGTQEDAFLEFPEGGRITAYSVADRWIEVEEPVGAARRVEFDYDSEGARIYALALGPDGRIYGSTGHPLRLFHFEPEAGSAESWGFDGSNGHINAFARRGNELFGGIYAGGLLVRYDLGRPVEHTRHGSNPQVLTRAGDVVMRPAAMAVHPNGREIIMTGGGGYGATGGGMLIHDTDTGKTAILTHEELIPLHSTNAFLFDRRGMFVGGTSTSAGTGGVRKATEAVVYLMDWERREVLFQLAPAPEQKAVLDLIEGPDGLVYGLTSGGWLFAFDPEPREVVAASDVDEYGATTGGQWPRVLQLDEDGTLYALFHDAIVRVESVGPDRRLRHHKIADAPVPITSGGMIRDGRIFFPSGSHLWSYDLRAETAAD